MTNTQLNTDIQDFNAADALFETANDTVYKKSGEVDGAKAALTPLEAAAATAVAKAKNAKRAFDRANRAKPKNQSAVLQPRRRSPPRSRTGIQRLPRAILLAPYLTRKRQS